MDRETEKALVAELRAGGTEAFDRVYDAYRSRVFAFLVRMSGRRELAEDLSQEVWLRLAKKAGELRADTRLRSWLFAVARNLVVSHLRWRALNDRALDRMLFGPSRGEVTTPAQVAEGQETAARLEEAVRGLPLAYREVVLLVAVERLSPAEAAEVLDLEPDAVRQRLSRARGMLSRALAEEPRRRKSL